MTEFVDESQESLRRLALGSNLVLVIPRDDFAKLMDYTARLEQGYRESRADDCLTCEEIYELSRIAQDLSEQADGQD